MHNDRSEPIASPGASSASPTPIGSGSEDGSPEARAERKIGYVFKDRTPLTLALIHASVAGTRLESNERLEFLGDAILGMVICDYLFRTYPLALEGELTKVKSNVVSRRSCAEIAMELGLDEDLVLGKGMGGRENLPSSLAAAAFESVIGAIYLDGGLDAARTFVLRHMAPRIEQASRLGHQHNFKSVLQQALQRCGTSNPAYLVVDERGPDHAKCFNIAVDASGRKFPACWGTSKKQAEQQAALTALLELGFASVTSSGDIVVRRIEQGEVLGEAPAGAPSEPAAPSIDREQSAQDPSRDSCMGTNCDDPCDAPRDLPPA